MVRGKTTEQAIWILKKFIALPEEPGTLDTDWWFVEERGSGS